MLGLEGGGGGAVITCPNEACIACTILWSAYFCINITPDEAAQAKEETARQSQQPHE